MQVKINKELLTAHKQFFKKSPWKMNIEARETWITNVSTVLAEKTKEQCEELIAVLETNLKIKGSASLIRDIKSWLRACEQGNNGQVRPRTAHVGHGLLVNYIRSFPHKHVYTRKEDDTEGIFLCYYVESLEYSPPIYSKADGRTPPYTVIECSYERFGKTFSARFTIGEMQILGHTAHESLLECGLYPETPELREMYLADARRYGEIKDLLGNQFMAIGFGSTQNVDGNAESNESHWWNPGRGEDILLTKNMPQGTRVLIDVYRESAKAEREGREHSPHSYFWKSKLNITEDGDAELADDDDLEDDDSAEITDDDISEMEIPVHPYLICFDIKRHLRMRIHVGNLTEYQYDKTVREKLVLPERTSRLIDTLLADKTSQFKDIVHGKSGGTLIICQGPPGTGKTLSAEVYSEFLERPLYSIQCSQLGTDPIELETNLMKCLARGSRWNAVVLLDEADVYLQERGRDLFQNAVVGVFLRVLEYFPGILFLTTNRLDSIDDAILSRCTARLMYDKPSKADQLRIWEILCQQNQIDVAPKILRDIVDAHPMAGRDIKNVLKLCNMITRHEMLELTVGLIGMIKEFRPTLE